MSAHESEQFHRIGTHLINKWLHEVKYYKIKFIFSLPENSAGKKYKHKERHYEQDQYNDQFYRHQRDGCPKLLCRIFYIGLHALEYTFSNAKQWFAVPCFQEYKACKESASFLKNACNSLVYTFAQ